MSDKSFEVPQADSKDVVHIGISTALSAIPFLGAGELFKFIVTPSLEKRRDQWMESIAQAVRRIEEKDGVTPESLVANEEFQTLLIEATQVALKTHLEDKRKRLIAVLEENATGKVPFDIASYRLRILDQLLPAHIKIVRSIPVGHAYPQPTKSGAIKMLSKDLDSSVSDEMLRTLVQDLENLGVIRCKNWSHGDEDPTYAYERTSLGWL